MAILTKYENKAGKPGKRFVRKHGSLYACEWSI